MSTLEFFLLLVIAFTGGYLLARLFTADRGGGTKTSSRVTTLPTPETGGFRSPFAGLTIRAGTPVKDLSAAELSNLCNIFRLELNSLSEDVWVVIGFIDEGGLLFECARATGYEEAVSTPSFSCVPDIHERRSMAYDILAHGTTNR